MTELVCVTGMVISSQPIGEADRRIVLLTRELGKISAFARSARKPNSHLVGQTRPFSFGKFYVYPGKDSYSLSKAEVSEYFEEIVQDVEKTAYGSYFMELTAYFAREGLDGTQLLVLLYYSMRALENEKLPNALVRTIFELRLMKTEGLLKDLSSDVNYSDSARYALQFIHTKETQKLFTFLLTEDVHKELMLLAEKMIRKNVDKELVSRQMLSILT